MIPAAGRFAAFRNAGKTREAPCFQGPAVLGQAPSRRARLERHG
jgi:hypothetical protein